MRTVKKRYIGVAFVRLVTLRGVLGNTPLGTPAFLPAFLLIRVPVHGSVALFGLLALAAVTAQAGDLRGETRRRFEKPNVGDCVVEVVLALASRVLLCS